MIPFGVRRTPAFVAEKLCVFPIIADQKILPTVVVVIAHREPPPHMLRPKIFPLRACHVHKPRLAHVPVQRLFLFIRYFRMMQRNVVENMPVDHQQIAPAIIIKIEKSRPKRTVQNIGLSHSGRDREIRESSVAVIAVQPVQLEIQVADKQVQQPVVHHVRRIRAHSRFGAPVFAETNIRFARRIAKGPVTIVQVQKIPLRIVGDENIRPAIAIQIGQHHCQALPVGIGQPCFFRYIRECAVAIVVVQLRCAALEFIRMAIIAMPGWFLAACLGMIFVVLHVISDQQV